MIKPLNEGDTLKAIADGAKLVIIISEASYENYIIPGHYVIPFIPESMHHLLEVIPSNTPIILGREEDAQVVSEKLMELGYDNILGHTAFDWHKWLLDQPDVDIIMNIDEEEFGIDCKHQEESVIVDLRDMEECANGYVEKALNIPLDLIEEKIEPLKGVKQLYLYCSDGFRSMLASSILKAHGLFNFKNVLTGMNDFNPEYISITKPEKKETTK